MLPSLDSLLVILTAIALAFIIALWVSLVIWTIRDIRARSKDPLLQVLSVLSVILFSFPGLLIYLILRPKSTFTETYLSALEEEALLQSVDAFHICPQCGRQAKPSWHYCAYCSNPLTQVCESCGENLLPDWNNCPNCGTTVPFSDQALDESVLPTSNTEADESQPEAAEFDEDDLIEENEFDSF
ncbi:MAG TPA: zinc ribbon domain-containing protein [Chloroflexi bacterium]|nr:zinc ribbon domain-containing protein [Chloroflexota bacterium]